MKQGGKRRGAGRKVGSKGKTSARLTLASLVKLGEGALPLEVMLTIMRDPSTPLAMRAEMAKNAAPYIHPRLQAITHSGPDKGPIPVAIASAKAELSGIMADLTEKLTAQEAAKAENVSTRPIAVDSDAPGGEPGATSAVPREPQ